MKRQANRLPPDAAKGMAGSAIDRSAPLRFRLDGREIGGFAGDTVLSALLADGIDTVGQHAESPLGLSAALAPAIAYVDSPQDALPPDRTPALQGAELVTAGQDRRPGVLARLFQPGRTLGLLLDQPRPLGRPWRDQPAEPGAATDLVVIGGGVAGMAAALAGAKAGLSVTLVDAHPQLGGHSGLFGTLDGEDRPEESVQRLQAAMAIHPGITVMGATEAFAMRPGLVRVHQVDLSGPRPTGRIIDLATRFAVIATGALERLPILPGNHLPGVAGALAAYELAQRYGVWLGQRTALATTTSAAYRLALLAKDGGVTVDRILDARPAPASRFIEFAKAYGIRQFPGTVPRTIAPAAKGHLLEVEMDATEESFRVDSLILSGGWQPDLTLWHLCGGRSTWSDLHHRLEAAGRVDGVALAGSAAGYLSRKGAIASGADAIDLLLGRPRKSIEDLRVDPLYETPDGVSVVAPPAEDAAPAYLDFSPSLRRRPVPAPRPRLALFRRRQANGVTTLAESALALSIGEVVAGVALGLIPPESAGVVAQERVALVPLALPGAAEETDAAQPTLGPRDVPPYLSGRFGPDARLMRVVAEDGRTLETGALLQRRSDSPSPLDAVGVVLRSLGSALGSVALVHPEWAGPGVVVTVMDERRAVRSRIEALSE